MSDAIEAHVAALETATKAELRALWQKTFGIPAPQYTSTALLRRCISYRLQETAYGGLDPRLVKLLYELAEGNTTTPRRRLSPGTRLVRSWGGNTHNVTVVDGGFDYRGKRYHSLSVIAREITGARWSGPRFFGLESRRA